MTWESWASVTATGEVKVPLMFLKKMSLSFTRDGDLEEQEAKGQYVWSIMMGLSTFFITMFSNVMFEAAVTVGEFSHVLIRIPFIVPVMVLSLTKSPFTSASSGYLPKLPTLQDQI